MEITWQTYLIVCPLIFLGGFIDAVAGGGGLITLPAYMLSGMPIHMAYGTNKFANSFGTAIATVNYAKGGYLKWKSGIISAVFSLVGAWLGSQMAVALSPVVLQYTLVVLLPVAAVFILINKNFGKEEGEEKTGKKLYVLSGVIGLVIGAYDGFFGPGAGTFMVLAFTGFLGFSLINASANAKLVNLASNVGALVTYLISGKVLFAVGIPAALCSILGNYIGTKLAIKIGAKFIRAVLFVAIGLLLLKILTDMFF